MQDRQQKRLLWKQVEGCARRLRDFDQVVNMVVWKDLAKGANHAVESMPLPLDLAQYTEVQTLITLPSSAEVDDGTYLALLPRLIQRWHTDVESSLRMLANGSGQPGILPLAPHSNDSAAPDTLSLARALFRCERCGRAFHAFELYTHPCLHSTDLSWHAFGEAALPRADGELPIVEGTIVDSARLAHYCGYQPWSPAYLTFRGHIADTVIHLCGKEPRTASIAELDACKTRLICRLCSRVDHSLMVMDWRAAVSLHSKSLARSDLTLLR